MDDELASLLHSEDAGYSLYGYQLESVVGIRYAQGSKSVKYGVWLKLSREPNNHYDPNAIRVDTPNGEKVGYIRGVCAQKLSVVLDNDVFANVKVKCVAVDSPDEYDVKVVLSFYGPDNSRQEITTNLQGALKSGVWLEVRSFREKTLIE